MKLCKQTLELLGKNFDDLTYQEFAQANGRIRQRQQAKDQLVSDIFVDLGITLVRMGPVIAIAEFHIVPIKVTRELTSPYTKELPYEVLVTDSRTDVRQKLGLPRSQNKLKAGISEHYYRAPGSVIFWYKSETELISKVVVISHDATSHYASMRVLELENKT